VVRLAIVFFLLFGALAARADSMSFPIDLEAMDLEFGDLTVTRIYDGRDPKKGPFWAVEIAKNGVLISRIAGAGFDDYAISAGGSILVGLSNGGYPDTAYMVIDASGRLLLFKRHLLEMSQYCEFTVSAVRKWYDGESPDIQFTDIGSEDAESITEFSVAGCGEERIYVRLR